ncbi:hypothetical protein [Bryobacter aggregatus]|uniref:hypothetical protein n=1 Tax=Bryobacter aggregatus TaxID=360054 RepID=UPI0004E278D4|nr:hypothetical protein [Bryobacter aggregatus]
MPKIPKLNGVALTGFSLLVLGFLSFFFSARNFWTYARMRTIDATVIGSQLHIDLVPAEGDSLEWVRYELLLDLQADGPSGRLFHWDTDAGRAAYPEEALDELQLWAPGTRHQVQMIRGHARELRLPDTEVNPELEKGIGFLMLGLMLGLSALGALAGLAEEHSFLRKFRWTRSLGVWTVFFGFGLLPLVGWIFFTFFSVQKLWTWQEVVAHRVEAAHHFDVATLSPEIHISPAAKEKLASQDYELITYDWQGRRLRGGIGHLEGVHDHFLNRGGADGSYCFRIHPMRRWELSANLGWNEDFWAPFGMLLFFGVAFCGAALVIRKT